MLLRSASTPLLNSWAPHHAKEQAASPEPEAAAAARRHHHPAAVARARPISLTASPSAALSPVEDFLPGRGRRVARARSESNLLDIVPVPPRRKPPIAGILNGITLEDVEEVGLDEGAGAGCRVRVGDAGFPSVLVGGGVVGGGGGGSDGGDGGGRFEDWDANGGKESTDLYYKRMIEADPGNALVLGNYARFLKEVRGDHEKAEEYCARAILANPKDGNVLSMYGDLIWQSHKDSERAENYFDRAVKAAPDDCYVMASYAHFLWDAEEDDDEEARDDTMTTSSPSFFRGASQSLPPLAAAS
ncbi:uncharacterized protein LOC115691242 [Syzygium oleosum]|uniref:uncharacterized protein LOC115691242 n=1 Tax=Syzygium oleosum TaxID=219896 RepID=UPI0024BB051F|nr:uncharacterized protein LOC115691242 [Syzygium oleosum]